MNMLATLAIVGITAIVLVAIWFVLDNNIR